MRKQPTSTGQFVGGIGLSHLSAAMLTATWPSLGNLWWLIGIAFVPMYIAQYRLLPQRWSALAVMIAFAGWSFGLWMLPKGVVLFRDRP